MPIHKNISKEEELLLIKSLTTDLVLGTSMIEFMKLANKQIEDSIGIPRACFKRSLWRRIRRALRT